MKNLLIFTVFVVFYGCVTDSSGEEGNAGNGLTETSVNTPSTIAPPVTNKTVMTTSQMTSTTHMMPTTATIQPTDIPKDPTTISYNVSDSHGNICILFSVAIQMNFKFQTKKDGKNETRTKLTEIPKAAHLSGSCNSNTQTLDLFFYDGWNLTVTFVKNSSLKEYTMKKIRLYYSQVLHQYPFPEAMNVEQLQGDSGDIEINDEWNAEDKSYICMSKRTIYTNSTASFGLIGIDLYNEQYSAFLNTTNPAFPNQDKRCPSDKVSNLIPIIVGACLGGLIIIVLIAYLVGRRRSKRGYESV